jgi:uncharacterized protein YndB with AHSA1/START domain
MEKYGTITAPGTIRFERSLPGPIDKVWAYLTESEKRGKWLAKGDMELFEGGKVELYFFHQNLSPLPDVIPEKYKNMEQGHHFTGTILKIDIPRLLSFTWEDQSEVTFELTEQEDRVLMILTHRKLGDKKSTQVSVASGWHNHVDILIANLKDETPQPFWKNHTKLEAIYIDRI